MLKAGCILSLLLLPFSGISQTGPGGVSLANGASTLQIWLDGWDLDGDGIPEGALESVVTGGLVTGWNNKSGHATRNLNTGTSPNFIAAHAGLNNMPTVSFVAGSSHYLQSSANVQLATGGNVTVYMVFDDNLFVCDACPTVNWRTAANVGGFTIEGLVTAHKHFAYNGAWQVFPDATSVSGNPYVYGVQFGTASRELRRNGTSLVISPSTGVTNANTSAPMLLQEPLRRLQLTLIQLR
jgi:hypothetical protein